jgi:hypothetical protein
VNEGRAANKNVVALYSFMYPHIKTVYLIDSWYTIYSCEVFLTLFQYELIAIRATSSTERMSEIYELLLAMVGLPK